ncbi:GNAT family N-acetyltransferase [Rhodanobacter sp. 7MK24]|nr:GNAT family N-acetyltransferase [Rhodanobacter sp. 7MK24]
MPTYSIVGPMRRLNSNDPPPPAFRSEIFEVSSTYLHERRSPDDSNARCYHLVEHSKSRRTIGYVSLNLHREALGGSGSIGWIEVRQIYIKESLRGRGLSHYLLNEVIIRSKAWIKIQLDDLSGKKILEVRLVANIATEDGQRFLEKVDAAIKQYCKSRVRYSSCYD